MQKKLLILSVLMFVFSLGICSNVFAAVSVYNLTLEAILDGESVPQTDFRQGDVLYLHVVLDNTTDVAGTAFTLTYDNNKITGPATDAEGLPVNQSDITSLFPFMYSTTETHRANSSESNKIYLAGAEIDTDTGGGKWGGAEITLFTLKFTVGLTAALGTHTFGLEQTELFNLDAGYGTDNDGNEIFSAGDTKDPVAILVGAIDNSDPNWGGDLSNDFPDLTTDLGALPSLQINILTCLDSDSDNLCDLVETNTGTYNGPNDTGTDPNNDDSDGDELKDGDEINTHNTDPNKSDTDGDGIDDKWEIDNGLNPNVSNDGIDTDDDGYSDLVEYQNGTNPNTQDDPYAYDNYDPSTDDRGPYQRVTASPNTLLGAAGNTVNLDVYYETSDNDNLLGGFGLRIHYDSSKLTWNAFSNVLDDEVDDVVVVSTEQDDSGDLDSDANTDKYLEITWTDSGILWPDVALPARLYTVAFDINGALDDGVTSSINFTASSVESGYTFLGDSVPFTVESFNCDIDGNGSPAPLNDGLLIIRYLFGFRGDMLINGAIGIGATRTSIAPIEAFLADGVTSLLLDIDGNGSVAPLNDGLLIIRYLFGFRGDMLINGAIGIGATRTTAAQIEAYISNLL